MIFASISSTEKIITCFQLSPSPTQLHFLLLPISLSFSFLLFFRYLESLVEYMSGYLEKIQPLLDQSTVLLEIKDDFESKWSQSQFPGWKVKKIPYIIIVIKLVMYYQRIFFLLQRFLSVSYINITWMPIMNFFTHGAHATISKKYPAYSISLTKCHPIVCFFSR